MSDIYCMISDKLSIASEESSITEEAEKESSTICSIETMSVSQDFSIENSLALYSLTSQEIAKELLTDIIDKTWELVQKVSPTFVRIDKKKNFLEK